MSQGMDCFGWQNRASDYLDGALIGAAKREADEHLEHCEACSTRYKHYRLILTSIASQPRVSLPVSIRKAPLAAPVTKGDKFRLRDTLRFWSLTPWFVKIPLESAAIVLMISVAISAAPRLRMLYERKMERSLTEYAEGFGSQDLAEDTEGLQPPAAPVPQASALAVGAQASVAGDKADFAGGDAGDSDSDSDNDDEAAPVKVGKGEIWRFNLKTDSPTEVRGKIVSILTNLNLPSDTPGIDGIEAPGGIQFDLMVPESVVTSIKAALEKIAPAAPKDTADTPLSQTFTWYKSRSKHPVPAGRTHVVIWLSQI